MSIQIMLFLMLFSTQQIAMQGKPNSTEHVRTFDIYTSINGEDWRKEKPILRKVGILSPSFVH